MSRFFVVTIFAVLLAILAPFFFSWGYALFVGVVASLLFPPAIIFTGVLLDVLYFNSHILPYFTVLSIGIAIAAYFVQQFVKTRIMS